MQNSITTLPMTVISEKIGFEVCNCVEKIREIKIKLHYGNHF